MPAATTTAPAPSSFAATEAAQKLMQLMGDLNEAKSHMNRARAALRTAQRAAAELAAALQIDVEEVPF